MILQQFYLNCLAHASYLIGDEQTQVAAVIDPQRDVDRYLVFASERGLQIRHVFLTHFHADFLAGHLELRERTGATIYLGASARAEYAFTPLADGDTVSMGQVLLKILETPGHTVESISIVVYDRARHRTEPQAVLTGDTLFVGDVGRPDLRVALGWPATELASMLYDSVQQKLLALPDSSLVYPAHGAGSLCGKALGTETFSTIGEQRRSNYALQPMSKEAFIRLVTADQPDVPAYFTYDAVLNSKERPTLEEALTRELNPVPLEHVLALQEVGAQLLDTREPTDFAAAHMAGSINIGLSGQYATWAGSILSRDAPIVIIADPGLERESATRLGRIGFDHIVGFLQGGLEALESRPDLMRTTERVSAAVAAARLSGADAPLIVDVRAPREREQKHIRGSVGLPLSQLNERVGELPRNRPLLVHCAAGYRSAIAVSLLLRQGFTLVSELAGGLAGWEAAHLPVEKAAEQQI